MKLQTITIEYAATRSQSYQSARLGRTVEMTLDEGENRNEAIKKVQDWLVRSVNQEAETALADLLAAT